MNIFVSSFALIASVSGVAFAETRVPSTFVEATISCQLDSNSTLRLHNDSFAAGGALERRTPFDFAPFITKGELFKRIRNADGQLSDIMVKIAVDLGNLDVTKDYVEDYNFGFATVVFAGIRPLAAPLTPGNIRTQSYRIYSLPATEGSTQQLDKKLFETMGAQEVVSKGDANFNAASPLVNLWDGYGDGTYSDIRDTTLVATFPGNPAGRSAKAFFSLQQYVLARDLLVNGHFNVQAGLPAASDLFDCNVSERRYLR